MGTPAPSLASFPIQMKTPPPSCASVSAVGERPHTQNTRHDEHDKTNTTSKRGGAPRGTTSRAPVARPPRSLLRSSHSNENSSPHCASTSEVGGRPFTHNTRHDEHDKNTTSKRGRHAVRDYSKLNYRTGTPAPPFASFSIQMKTPPPPCASASGAGERPHTHNTKHDEHDKTNTTSKRGGTPRGTVPCILAVRTPWPLLFSSHSNENSSPPLRQHRRVGGGLTHTTQNMTSMTRRTRQERGEASHEGRCKPTWASKFSFFCFLLMLWVIMVRKRLKNEFRKELGKTPKIHPNHWEKAKRFFLTS